MTDGLITREKQYALPGSNWKVEWKWLYRVNGVAIGYRLKEAENWAKNRGLKPVRDWEQV